MRKLVPLPFKVIVKDLGAVTKIGNVILPQQADREYEAHFGEVTAIGEKCFTESFQCFSDIAVGSLIAYGYHATARVSFKWEHERLSVVMDEDVLAHIIGETAAKIRKELADA